MRTLLHAPTPAGDFYLQEQQAPPPGQAPLQLGPALQHLTALTSLVGCRVRLAVCGLGPVCAAPAWVGHPLRS